MKGAFRSVASGLGAVILFLAMQLLTSAVFLFIAKDADAVLDLTVHITLVSALGTLAVLAVIAAAGKRDLFRAAHLFPLSGVLWAVCLTLGLGLNLAVSGILSYIPFPESWVDSYSSSSSLLSIDNIGLYLIAVVLAGPFTEELVFRRMAYGCVKECLSPLSAAILSSFIFGVCHGTLLWMIYTVPLGLLLCLCYSRCRSLWGSIAVHIGFNLGSVITEYIPADISHGTILLLTAAGSLAAVGAFIMLVKYTKRSEAPFGNAAGEGPPMEK